MATTCSIPGCDRPRYGHGLCNTHWQRKKKGKDLLAPIAKKGPAYPKPRCTVEGCDLPQHSRGYCSKHYAANYERLKAEGVIKRLGATGKRAPRGQRTPCAVEGCDRPAVGANYCAKHYQRWQKHGDPLKTVNAPAGSGHVDAGGYRRISVNGRRHVMEHRHVMEQMLVRPLLSNETVHHKNGDKLDNRPENLELWTSSHPRGQRIEDVVAHAREIIELYG